MLRHYDGIAQRMISELETISDEISHAGEKGRNNEEILKAFLARHLPTRYTVSTGKVVSVGGRDSGQIDLIVHDRLDTPLLFDARACSLVPIESVYAVISVKTTLNKDELRDAIKSIESVRALPRAAALSKSGNRFVPVSEDQVLRPRALVFAFRSTWASFDSCQKAFVDLLNEVSDDNRPNGVCVLKQGFMIRRPFTTSLIPYVDHALMHFFMFLVRTIGNRPQYHVDISKYFSDDYGQRNGA
jgi:hypothetical protein